MRYITGVATATPKKISTSSSVYGLVLSNLSTSIPLLISFDLGRNYHTVLASDPPLIINSIYLELYVKTSSGSAFFNLGLDSSGSSSISIKEVLPDPLYDFSFKHSVEQRFPESSIGRASALNISTGPDHIWSCQQDSGDLIDTVNFLNLEKDDSPYQGQKWPGIGDGNRKAIEFKEQSTDAFRAPNTTDLTHDSSTSFSYGCVFRDRGIGTTTRSILGKRSPSGTSYHWVNLSNSGAVQAQLNDGTTLYTLIVAGTHNDGAPHYAYLVVNRSLSMAYLYTDQGSDSISISGADSFDDTAAKFSVGRTTNNAHFMQVQDICYWVDLGAEEVDDIALSTWWVHGSDPTGLLTTQSRPCTISVPVSPTEVAHFGQGSLYDQLPIGYHYSLNEGLGGYGLYCNNAIENLITYSELLSNWTQSGTSSTSDNQADSPDGFRSASLITAGAADDFIKETVTTSTSTEYTFSCWIRQGIAGETGRLIIYDETGASELDSQIFTATGAWQLVQIVATTNVGQVSTSLRVEIDNDGDTVLAWGAQFNLGNGRGAYARSNGLTSNLIESDYRSINKVPTNIGRYTADFCRILDIDGALNGVCDTGSLYNRRMLRINALDQMGFQCRDGGTASWFATAGGSIVDNSLQHAIFRWDVDAGDFPEDISYTATAHLDGSAVSSSSIVTTNSELFEDLLIGRTFSMSQSLDGYIERIRIYDKPGEEPV